MKRLALLLFAVVLTLAIAGNARSRAMRSDRDIVSPPPCSYLKSVTEIHPPAVMNCGCVQVGGETCVAMQSHCCVCAVILKASPKPVNGLIVL